MISLIVACDIMNAIGKDNELLWSLPNDMKHFREKTTGHVVVMGRKTYESIGKPLPNRHNIIISKKNSNGFFLGETFAVCHADSIEFVLDRYGHNTEIFVIGGESIYKQFLPYADRIYLTRVYSYFDADSYFPEFNGDEWELGEVQFNEKDEKNPYHHAFVTYNRKKVK